MTKHAVQAACRVKRTLADERIGKCTYCGTPGVLHRDHVPPKGLFPSPRPNNLITVPACDGCNLGASRHDEYFRTVVALRGDVGGTPAGRRVQASVLRALNRPGQRGFRKAIDRATEKSPILDSRGSPLSIIEVQVDRLAAVVNRITAGLFFHFFLRRVPNNCKVGSQFDSEFGVETLRQFSDLNARLDSAPLMVSHPGVYQSRCVVDSETPDLTVWRHRFYDSVSVMSATIPMS